MRVPHECAVSCIAGIVSHICYFNRGEHHLRGAAYFKLFWCTFGTAVAALVYWKRKPVDLALSTVSWIAVSYLTGLYSSLLLYRLFSHPLNKFPGPFGARVSNLWFSTQLKNRDAFKKVQKLHQRYGHFVRIGSSDLSITHPKAVNIIYGPSSKCTKAEWYDIMKPMISLHMVRDKVFHDQRRRIWSTAFSDKALRGYEKRIQVYRNKLMSRIEESAGRPFDITRWSNLYNFDIMGDLAFGTSFKMLETSTEHYAIKLLNAGMDNHGLMLPMWFMRLMMAVPRLTSDWWRAIAYCNERMDERIKSKNDGIPDIVSSLLASLQGKPPHGHDLLTLQGDAQLIVIAGSDTTATALTCVFFELAKHPDNIAKLRNELAPYMTDPSGEVFNHEIAHLEHLNAVIYETLRLHPSVPTALQRKTPPEGIYIEETYVPGDMTVWCSQYVLGRSEEVYARAEEFIPERWYLYPDMIKEKSAFAPFSLGPYGCIGRPLALLNLRTTIAQIIMSFDFRFAPGEDGRAFEEQTKDHFTVSLGPLNMSFTKRSEGI